MYILNSSVIMGLLRLTMMFVTVVALGAFAWVGSIHAGQQVFDIPGADIFTTPAGVDLVTVQAWGAGGGGGGDSKSDTLGAPGGGGGAYARTVGVAVTPSTGYSIEVGAAGLGVVQGAGTAGGDSFFNTAGTVMAKGGTGGTASDKNGAGVPGTGGAAGASVGTTKYSGGDGFANVIQTGGGGGGSAGTGGPGNSATGNPGATAVTGGGPGGNGGSANNFGFPPASGPGGGGGGSGNLRDGAGGRGEDGKVIVGWGPQVTTVKKSGQADPTNALPVSFTVTFSEEVQDFDPVNQPADVDFTGSTATGLSVVSIVQENLVTYTVNVNCTGNDGDITIAIPALRVTDNYGNGNFASTPGVDNVISYTSNTNPTVTIDKAFSQITPTNSVPVDFTVVFSEAVNGFDTSDINLLASGAVGVSAVSVTSVNATTYTVAVTAGGPGTIVASINAGVVTSAAAGLPNVASTSPVGNSVLFDDERPSVTITSPGATTVTSPVAFTIDFSEAVTGFALGDIVLSGGAQDAVLLDIAPPTGPADSYTVRVTTPYNGFVTLTVNDGAATDAATNTSTAQSGGDNTTEYVGGSCFDPTVSTIDILPAQIVSGASIVLTDLFTTTGNVSLFTYEINTEAVVDPWYSAEFGLEEGGQTVTLKVMGTDPDCGGVPVSATETITVENFGLSFLVHSSTSTGSSKWGGDWGTDTGKYGEITCGTCHSRDLAETGANIKRVRTNLPTVGDGSDEEPTENFPGSAETIAFTTGVNQSSEMGDDSDGHTTSSKICEVCHTYDATGANGVTYHGYDMSTASAFDKSHANQTDCIICHKHSEGFKAAGCNACHGEPPTDLTSMVTLDMDGATTTGALADPAAAPGAHSIHGVTRTMACETCHQGNTMPVPSKTIEMGFEVNSTNVPGWNTNPAGEVTNGDITVYDTLSNGFSFIDNGVTTVTPEATQDFNCTVYCHGSWPDSDSEVAPYAPPSWVGGPLGACSTSACHGSDSANPPATGSHVAHAASSGAVKLACNKCHPAYADTSHVDGDVAWALATGDSRIGASATYATLASGTTGSKAPSASFGDCANVYCHGANTPNWGDPAIGCAACHSASNALEGGHATHYASATVVTENNTNRVTGQNAYMFGCGTCHNTASTSHVAGPAIPGLRSAEISLSYNDDVAPHTDSPDRGFLYTEGACFSNQCHNNGKASPSAPLEVAYWGGSLRADCTGCHANDATATFTMNTGAHTAHTSAAAIMAIQPCQTCHDATVDADNRVVPNDQKDMHVNGSRDVAILGNWDDNGGTPTDNWNGTSCDGLYCHSNGQDVGTRVSNSVTWGETLGCDGCHGIAGETTALTGSHLVHIGSDSSDNNKQFGFTCDQCHAETALDNNNIVNVNNHINQSRDVAVSVGDGGTGTIGGNFSADKCATTNCHGSLSEPWAAGASKGNCTTCHDYTGTPSAWRDTASETLPGDQQVGAHAAHLNATSGYNVAMDCNECHLTVYNAIDAQTTYVNKVGVAGHNDNNSDAGADISWSNLAKRGGLMTPMYDPATGTCSMTYCHGGDGLSNGLLGAVDPNPVWTNSQYLSGIITKQECEKCHGAPPQGKGHAGTEALTECGNAGCHDNTMNEGSATFNDLSLHVNGTVDNSAVCSTCHPQMPPPQGSHPKHGIHLIQDLGYSDGDPAGQLSDWLPGNYQTCSICHDMTDPSNHLEVPGQIYVMGSAKADQRFSDQPPSWPTYDGDPGVQSCTNVKCHFVATPKWEP